LSIAGVPWTEEEHKLFLLGLQKVGKGDWRGISRNFVKTRTPTQVASHAQKYFLRRSNLNRRRRRSSLFDITTDTVIFTSLFLKTLFFLFLCFQISIFVIFLSFSFLLRFGWLLRRRLGDSKQ
jgi:SHAQKYF class myb-like DNA-binding protein